MSRRDWRSTTAGSSQPFSRKEDQDTFRAAMRRIGLTQDGEHIHRYLVGLIMEDIDPAMDEGALRQKLAERTVAQKLLTVLKGEDDHRHTSRG